MGLFVAFFIWVFSTDPLLMNLIPRCMPFTMNYAIPKIYMVIMLSFVHCLKCYIQWAVRVTCLESCFETVICCSNNYIYLWQGWLQNLNTERLLLPGVITQGVPCTVTIFRSIVHSPSEFWSFLIHPPELSGRNRQRQLVVKQGGSWWEIAMNFASVVSLSYTSGFFNMP
jgi:hypothetical protein